MFYYNYYYHFVKTNITSTITIIKHNIVAIVSVIIDDLIIQSSVYYSSFVKYFKKFLQYFIDLIN